MPSQKSNTKEREEERRKTHLLAGKVDAHSTVPDQIDRDLVLVAGHSRDNHITDSQTVLERPALLVLNGVLLLAEPASTTELLHARHVHTVHLCAIIRQQRGQRPTYDLGAVDDGYPAAVQTVAVREDGVVDLEVLEDLDDGERGAGQDALLLVGGRVEEADVLVHVVDEVGREALDILALVDDILDCAVAAGVEDGVVDDDAVDGAVLVCGADGILEVLAVELFQGKGEAAVARQRRESEVSRLALQFFLVCSG